MMEKYSTPVEEPLQTCLEFENRGHFAPGWNLARHTYDAGSAAMEVGYESATQFNREYSRLFGQPPTRKVIALRQISGGDTLRSAI
jgi:AraC-like DNA-binding protein